MAYTKQMAQENKQMKALARDLLLAKGGWEDTLTRDHQDIIDEIANRFPSVNPQRVPSRVSLALMELRGDTVRSRGAPQGNRNAAKDETKIMWTRRLSLEVINFIRQRSKEFGIDQTEYVTRLVLKDNDRI